MNSAEPIDSSTLEQLQKEIDFSHEEMDLKNNNNECNQVKLSFEQIMVEIQDVIDSFMNNDIEGAFAKCSGIENYSMYHSLANSMMKFIIAIVHLEQEDLQAALEQIKKTLVLIQKNRRKNTLIESFANILRWKSTDYNEYTDEEVHAELMLAEMQICLAFMNFLGEQSMLSMIKGALRIKSAHSTYKTCQQILKCKKNWSSNLSHENFKAGYLLGNGLFNLYLSHLPAKIINLLAMVGFSGDYSTAVNALQEVCDQLKSSIRSRVCQIMTTFYALYIEYIFGIGGKSSEWTEKQVNDLIVAYPNGALPLLLSGRSSQIRGYPDLAMDYYRKCLSVNSHWKSLNAACYWDLAWCSARKLDWIKAAEYTKKINECSNYSPAIMEYQYACFLLMHIDSGKCELSEVQSLKEVIFKSMEQVPLLRIRYAGKTIPVEKFSLVRAQEYTSGTKRELLLPALELYYIWNMFAHAAEKTDSHEPFLNLINAKYDQNAAQDIDELCTLHLLKGVTLTSLGWPFEAIEYYKKILEVAQDIQRDHFLPPHATFELGYAYMKAGDIQEAKIWLEKSRSEYSGFLIEAMIHLKVHTALLSLKRFEKSGESNTIGSCNPRKLVKTMSTVTEDSVAERNNSHKLKRHVSFSNDSVDSNSTSY